MPLEPFPTADEIEAVRDIALLYSYEYAETLVGSLNQAQREATREDLILWAAVKNKHTRIKGDGLDIDKSRDRLAITNRLRRRFGLLAVDESGNLITGLAGSVYCSYTPVNGDDNCGV